MRWLRALRVHWTELRRDAGLVGLRVTVILRAIELYNAHRRGSTPAWRPTLKTKIAGFAHPLYLRAGTTDFRVLWQIVAESEYAPLRTTHLKVVVDCGAYVGYSALYFLNHHSDVRVLAVEPDAENAAICRRNLAPYGDRARLVEAAVWGHRCTVGVVKGEYRDGGAWATAVRPRIASGARPVDGLDMPALFRLAGADSVDLLKIDVEGSEIAIFEPDARSWLRRVRNIAIELHDKECEDAFFAALEPFDFELSKSGERTICRDITARRASSAAIQ